MIPFVQRPVWELQPRIVDDDLSTRRALRRYTKRVSPDQSDLANGSAAVFATPIERTVSSRPVEKMLAPLLFVSLTRPAARPEDEKMRAEPQRKPFRSRSPPSSHFLPRSSPLLS